MRWAVDFRREGSIMVTVEAGRDSACYLAFELVSVCVGRIPWLVYGARARGAARQQSHMSQEKQGLPGSPLGRYRHFVLRLVNRLDKTEKSD